MTNNSKNTLKDIDNDEIDIFNFLKILFQRKRLIIISTFIFLILGYLSFKFKKPVWQGEFDIVLTSKESGKSNNNPLASINSSTLSNFIKNNQLDLKTEVQILKSRSILMPTFDFVKDQKMKKGINVSSLTFDNWKNSLNIDLKVGTSVLNIKYFDSDKNLIKPVLENISSEYQKYSGKDRFKGLSNGISYLEKELKKMEFDAEKSMRRYQEFSIKHNLGDFDGLIPKSKIDKSSEKNFLNFYKSNNSRFNANFEKLYFLESLLLEKSASLKPDSEYIIGLKSKIESMKKSLSRPSKILLEFRDIERQAIRDQRLLLNIENQLAILKLDLARKEDLWELISIPTVLNQPVAPKLFKSLLFSSGIGFILSCIYVLVIYKKEDYISNTNILKQLIPYTFLKTFENEEKEKWKNSIELIKDKIYRTNVKGNIAIYIDVKISKNIQYIVKLFQESFVDEKIIVSEYSRDLIDCENVILVFELAYIKNKNLVNTLEEIKLIDSKIFGWILIV